MVRRPASPDGLRFISAPLGFGVVGLGMLIYGCLADLNPLAVALSALALVAVMARLMLTFRDNVTILRASRDEAMTDALTGLGNRRALARDARRRGCPRPTTPARSCSCSSTSTASSTTTTPSATPRATRCSSASAATSRPTCRGRGPRLPDGRRRVLRAVPPGRRGRRRRSSPGAATALTEHGEGFTVTCSYGAIVLPREAQDATEALRIADQRMYAQKNAGPHVRDAPEQGRAPAAR